MAAKRKSIFQNVSDLVGVSETTALDLSGARAPAVAPMPPTPEKPPAFPAFPGLLHQPMPLMGTSRLFFDQLAMLQQMMEMARAAGPKAERRPSGSDTRSPEFPHIASAPNSNGTILMLASTEPPAPAFPASEQTPTPPPSVGGRQPPRFQCPDCSRSYSTFSGLSKHRQFHCNSQLRRQFACKYCEKEYSSLGALKMHIRTHTLPCKCGVCGKAFSRPWLLQGHLRTHTGEKPFRCGHCGRSFADRSNLRAHLQTHSEVKKYRCGACAKTFSRMSLLHKHEANGCPANLLLPS